METRRTSGSFLQLESVHEGLGEIFLSHQAALVQGDLKASRTALDRFGAGLRAHIRVEEEVLLPYYLQGPAPPIGGSAEILENEHRKVEGFLDEFDRLLSGLEKQRESDALGIVELIEREARLKELLIHHNQREHETFYPGLDRAIPEPERGTVLARCTAIQKESGAP
ncbi:MAG: hemerythrin domain-containing protein [Planctomycetota bacterium]